MSSSEKKPFNIVSLLIDLVLTGIAFVIFYKLVHSHVPSSDPKMVMLWGGLTFAGLTLNNIALILDVVVFPEMDLQPVRAAFAFVSILPLLFGLVWES